MALTLYSFAGDFRSFKAQIAAKYNGVTINQPAFKVGEDDKKPEFLAKTPLGKVPVLDTPDGSIFMSNAIARYVAKLRRDTELYGVSFFQSGQVDAWLDFCSNELELPVTLWVYAVLGMANTSEPVLKRSCQDVHKALGVLEAHLKPRTFMVGNKITLADIVLVSTLLYPFKLVLDASHRASYPSVTRWFMTCVAQPQFYAVVGDVPLATEELAPEGKAPIGVPAFAKKAAKGGKKAGKAKGGKGGKGEKKEGEKKKAAPAPAPAPAKKKGPFDGLPKSPMVLDMWKKCYSNSRSNWYASMPKFWADHFDKEGYSLWFCKYNYNEENKVDFMTSNLVTGFIQRTEELRKYAFGTMQILQGTKGYFEIYGAWLIRGHDIAPMLECNADAEYYTWTKMDINSEEEKTKLADLWCAEEKIFGLEIMDGKVFK